MMQLQWNVYRQDLNGRRIEPYNVFEHKAFRDSVKKFAKKYPQDKDAFTEELRKELMYWFWCKCEWEIVLTSWPEDKSGRFKEKKIDVYDQIRMNWCVFADYVWQHRREL